MKRLIRFLKSLFRYLIFGKRVSFKTYIQRMGICSKCSVFEEKNWTCGECGCYVDKKAKMSTEKCPKEKW